MYLSKVKLDWKQAKNPYEQHRALWKLFPDRPDKTRGFLYRVEQITKGQSAAVIMQSGEKPQQSEEVDLQALRELSLNLQQGQRLRFRLRANPIKTIKDKSKGTVTNSKNKTYTKTVRVPLIREEQQQAWIERKFDGAAEIETVIIQQELPLNFRKFKEKRSGKIQPVLFDGIVTVQNPEAFTNLLEQGIGPAKSFGCGMLSLARG